MNARRLLVIAMALRATSLPTTASALPPDCERYGDKPCIVLREVVDEYCDEIHKLLFEPPPVPIC